MKRLALFLLSVIAWGAAPTITPSATGGGVTVQVNTTQQFTANQAVTWSLVSGSGGSISAGGLYTAPSSITSNNTFLGIQALPNDHVFNTRIDALPVQSAWTTYIHAQLHSVPIHFGVGFADNLYTNSTSTTSMLFNYTPLNNGAFPILGFSDIAMDGGVFANVGIDHHILGVNRESGQFSEMYKLYSIGSFSGCLTCNSQSGYQYSDDYTQPPNGTTDASGMPILPLALRYSELTACAAGGPPIKHALRFSLSNGLLASAFVWPATTYTQQGNTIPYGARIRLKAAFDISSYNATQQCVLALLKNYGMLMADGGLNMDVSTMQDAADSFDLRAALTGLYFSGPFNSDQFEFVDESSLEDSTSTSPAYQSGRVDSGNAYVVPDNFVTVKACNGSAECSIMPVILRPVTIGTTQSIGYSFMAGAPAYQLPIWVTGSATTTFTCAMSPTLGTLTSGCLYTPPVTSTTRQTTTVTITSTADSSQTLAFTIWVYPQGGIRERLSPTVNTDYGPDVNGDTWFINAGSLYQPYGVGNCDFSYLPANPWPGVPDIQIYYYCGYDSNDDWKYKFIVPNGIYTVTMDFGIGGTSPFPSNTFQLGIDSQGVVYGGSGATTVSWPSPASFLGVTGKNIDVCNIVVACANATPGQVTFTSVVSDNTIYVAIRHMTSPTDGATYDVLTAISITPGLTTHSGSTRLGPKRLAGPKAYRQ